MADRLPCCVPFCRRTTARGAFSEWICAKHWSAVSAATKRRRTLARRAADRANRRFSEAYTAQGNRFLEAQLDRALAAMRLADALWQRCKREAIDRAAGIA